MVFINHYNIQKERSKQTAVREEMTSRVRSSCLYEAMNFQSWDK